MFSRYRRSVEEWEILAGALALGAGVTVEIGMLESEVVVEGDSEGVPEELILLFEAERLGDEAGRLEGKPPTELARARGNFRCVIF